MIVLELYFIHDLSQVWHKPYLFVVLNHNREFVLPEVIFQCKIGFYAKQSNEVHFSTNYI